MTDQIAIRLAVAAMRVLGFSLATIIRFGIGIAALAAGGALPVGIMFGIRAGWFNERIFDDVDDKSSQCRAPALLCRAP